MERNILSILISILLIFITKPLYSQGVEWWPLPNGIGYVDEYERVYLRPYYITIGRGIVAEHDPFVHFDGANLDGSIIWKTDENYFNYINDILINEGKSIYFDSTDTYIVSNTEISEDMLIGADDDIIIQPDGNVGIGTITPTTKLQVSGYVSLDPGSDDTSGIYYLDAALDNNYFIGLLNKTGDNSERIGFYKTDTWVGVFDENGDFGMGVNNPEPEVANRKVFHIEDTTDGSELKMVGDASSKFTIDVIDNGAFLGTRSNDDLVFQTNNESRVSIGAGGETTFSYGVIVNDVTVTTDNKVHFRDNDIYIHSSDDGDLKVITNDDIHILPEDYFWLVAGEQIWVESTNNLIRLIPDPTAPSVDIGNDVAGINYKLIFRGDGADGEIEWDVSGANCFNMSNMCDVCFANDICITEEGNDLVFVEGRLEEPLKMGVHGRKIITSLSEILQLKEEINILKEELCRINKSYIWCK